MRAASTPCVSGNKLVYVNGCAFVAKCYQVLPIRKFVVGGAWALIYMNFVCLLPVLPLLPVKITCE